MSTLRRFQCNPRTVVTNARMLHSSSGRHTLVVEGEADYRLFLQWLVEKNARLVNVDGKENVINVWKTAKDFKFANLHCIADIDYEVVVGAEPIDDGQFIYVSLSKGVTVTEVECNDLESALIRSSALLKIMSQKYKGKELYTDFSERVDELRELLRVASSVIGSFRAAEQRLYGLHGRSVIGSDFCVDESYFDPISVTLSLSKLSAGLMRSSRLGTSAMRDLVEVADELRKRFGDGWQLTRGHDIAEMLALHLSAVVGRYVSCKEIEEDLRMACEFETIRSTKFGKSLIKIGSSNGKPLLSS